MTNDKQIEAWRKEFESGKSESSIQRDYRKPELYWNDPVQHQWEGFLMAKRSMPPIELPKEDFIVGPGGQVDEIYSCNQIKESITAAGFSYRVKE